MAIKEMSEYERKIARLKEKIEDADAIVIGGAAGMSAAAGYNFYYDRDEVFLENFGEFEKRYGYHNAFDGFYYRYRTDEERWAFIARMIKLIYKSETGKPYEDLREIVKDKEFFVVTTNQDTQFERVFPVERVSAIQGDWRYFQCSRRCHDAIYYNEESIMEMDAAAVDLRVPKELLPRCPKCGSLMEPWVRSYVFLEGEKYKSEYEKYYAFLNKYKDKKLLFLELGVGRMTPMFIKQPFWNMTYSWKSSFYVTINPKDALLPSEIAERGMAMKYDIAEVMRDLRAEMGR